MHERYKRRVENYLSLTKELSNDSIETHETVINGLHNNGSDHQSANNYRESETTRNRVKQSLPSQESQCTSSTSSTTATTIVPDIEDILSSNESQNHGKRSNDLCSSSFACSGQSRQQCQEIVRDYRQQQQAFLEFYNDIQSVRHTAYLILLICSMFVVSQIDVAIR